MHGAQHVRRHLRRGEVGRALQADREAVQARPPRFRFVAVLDPMAGVARSHRRHQRGIQPARQQHAVGHVGHQLAVHGGLERLAQFGQRYFHAFHRRVIAPRALVVFRQLAGRAVVPVPRRELRHVGTIVGQRLHFRSHPQPAFGIVAPVQRHHPDRIAGNDRAPFRAVPQCEREDAVEAVEEAGGLVFPVERADDLAIRLGLERIRLRQFTLQRQMVVDLAVDRQRQFAVRRQQRLRTASRIDDGQPLVHEDCAVVGVDAAPVRAAMALPLRAFQRLPPQGLEVVAGLQPEDAEDGAHGGNSLVDG